MADNKIYIFHTSPNQKTVVTKKTISDAEHKYGKCNIDATLRAARELTDRAFKLYIRMNLHQDGFTYALSPVEIKNSVDMSGNRYHDAVKELIKKGYLVQCDNNKLLYYFYEYPAPESVQQTDDTSKMQMQPIENEAVIGENRTGNLGISAIQIGHHITSHTTKMTEDISNMDNSLDSDYRAFFVQKEQERKRKEVESSQVITYDADDAIMYELPETGGEHDTDLENELPF